MKLNLHIILDELNIATSKILSRDDVERTLIGVRNIPADLSTLSAQYVYLANGSSLSDIQTAVTNLQFILYGGTDETILTENGWSAILLPDETGKPIFDEVQSIFEKFNQWEEEILLTWANGNTIHQIFEVCARLLRNPIALFDLSMVLIIKAGIFPEVITHSSWAEVLSKGYTQNYLSPDERIKQSERFQSLRMPFTHRNERFKDETVAYAILQSNGEPFALLTSTDILAPLTTGQLSILYHIHNILETMLIKEGTWLLLENRDDSLLIKKIISGVTIDNNGMTSHLKKRQWNLEDNINLLFIQRSDGFPLEKMIINTFCNTIKGYLFDTIVFPYDDGILVISHFKPDANKNEIYPGGLKGFLETNDLVCAVSTYFNDFMYIKHAFNQCKTVLKFMNNKNDQRICWFDTIYKDYIVQLLSDSSDLHSLCNPKVLDIYHKWVNGRDYIRSLEVYLLNGRNVTLAANMLHIHRNTLIYRLNRITEKLKLDYKNLDENALLALFLSSVIAPCIDQSK